jgi:hypothetical protein
MSTATVLEFSIISLRILLGHLSDLPVVFGELFQLVPPRIPKFRKPVYEQHQWFGRISLFHIMKLDALANVSFIKKRAMDVL